MSIAIISGLAKARTQVNNGQYNAASIPTTAPAGVAGNISDADWNPAVVSTAGAATSKYDLLIVLALVVLIVIFERNS